MPRRAKQHISDVAQQVRDSVDEEPSVDTDRRLYFPTGSTLLNLAVSDNAFGGYGAGKVGNLVGDSNTGKSLLAITGLMEMAMDSTYDETRLIYDDAENALEMNVPEMFGDVLAERVEDPYGNAYGSEEFRSSETIEDVRNNVWNLLDEGEPFFYVLDSYDAVTTRDELARQAEDSKAQKKIDAGEQAKLVKKDYPRGPAVLSETLRKTKSRIKFTDSFLLVVSQTRDVIDAVSFAATKRRAGGNALRFYSSHEIWLAVGKNGQLHKSSNGVKYTIGWNIRARSQRSKLTGKRREVPMICYTDYGVDDIGANVDWMLWAGAWSGSKVKINTKGFLRGVDTISRDKLIIAIEEGCLEDRLRKLVQKKWTEIEDHLSLNRKPRWRQ